LHTAQAHLDLSGEPADSPRRQRGRGAHAVRRLFEDSEGRAVDVYLLDEHYERAPLPCAHVAHACSLPQNAHTVRLALLPCFVVALENDGARCTCRPW
jgi:hypothetical protein